MFVGHVFQCIIAHVLLQLRMCSWMFWTLRQRLPCKIDFYLTQSPKWINPCKSCIIQGCLKFRYNGKCVETCPPKERYNSNTRQYEFDPNGTFAYNRDCVSTCPGIFICYIQYFCFTHLYPIFNLH